MNNMDYIVPIYYEGEFNGSGFIVGNRLITAAHVVVSKEKVCFFLYKDKRTSIGPENNMLYEYPITKSNQGQNNRYLDLAIYKTDIVSSLELCKPNIDNTCTYQGYSDVSLQLDIYDNIKLDDKDWYYPLEEEKPIRINNTYIAIGGKTKGGNSGGPLFQGDYVVGMFVGNQQYQSFSMDRFIKSDYILKKLPKL